MGLVAVSMYLRAFCFRKVGPSRALAPVEHKLGARVPSRRAAFERPGVVGRARPQRAIFYGIRLYSLCFLGAGGAHKIGLKGLFSFLFSVQDAGR